jgi:CheY-like chemotaxis protein
MQRSAAERTLDVLVVEDNPADIRLMREAWQGIATPFRLHVVSDGDEALTFLRRQPPFADVPRPGIVILDLNLPRCDGRELLGNVKVDAGLRQIPVVVLTTSDRPADILESYELHANCYVIKPIGLDPALHALRAIAEFWFTVASLPS